MKLTKVNLATDVLDPIDWLPDDEVEAERRRADAALPKPTNVGALPPIKLTTIAVPVIRHPRRKDGHIEDVDSYIRHINVHEQARAEVQRQKLTPAGGEVEDQNLLGYIHTKTEELHTRADAYAKETWDYEPGSQASLSQQSDVGDMLAKNDNVKALGARITEMAADDPQLKQWLTDNADAGWWHEQSYDDWGTVVNGDLHGAGTSALPQDKVEAAALYYSALAQYAWAEDSTDSESGLSQAMQASASKLFGVQDDVSIGDFGDASTPFSDAYITATYERTQRQLKAAGIDKAFLHRGMSWTDTPPPDWVSQILETGDITPTGEASAAAEATMNPMSSWSASEQVAVHFTRMMSEGVIAARLGAQVPAARILSMPFSGPGCLSEMEFIVLGSGSVQVTVY